MPLPQHSTLQRRWRHAWPLLAMLLMVLSLTGCEPQSSATQSRTVNPANTHSSTPAPHLRIATFNIAMGFEQPGMMAAALQDPAHVRLRKVAAILQTVRPDIVLLNEFDYDTAMDAAGLLNRNFLARATEGRDPIDYPYHFRAESNTGIPSGLDIGGDGEVAGPADAWGFGHFPGQYGMLLLSRYPIDLNQARTFQHFRWHDLAGARRPVNPDGSEFYSGSTWQQLRLSSKSHWDVSVKFEDSTIHVLAFHPTPPVFDGPENRNGRRNFDEIRFWADYLRPDVSARWEDDQGRSGGLPIDSRFVILGDMNSDPNDGDSLPGASQQLLEHEQIQADFVPQSRGAVQASREQGGVNLQHVSDPAADTADFADNRVGNLRLDYVLPSHGLRVLDGGVFWPMPGDPGHAWVDVSDHHLVWLDVALEAAQP